MPFKPISFEKVDPIKPYMPDWVGDISKSYEQGVRMKALPEQLKSQQEGLDLANALREVQLKYYPEMAQSRIGRTQATADLERQRAVTSQASANKIEMLSNILSQLSGGKSGQSKPGAEVSASSDFAQALFNKMVLGDIETPGQKSQRELESFKKKKMFEQELSGGETTRFKTQNQLAAQGIENTIPLLKELMDMDVPGQGAGYLLSPNKQAKYSGIVANITDSLVAALGLPKSNESLKTIEKMIGRMPRESDKSYKRRLEDVGRDLESRYKKITGKDLGFSVSDNKKEKIIGPNGKVYLIPSDKVEQALKAGGRRG